MATPPPPPPWFVLRGHTDAVVSVQFTAAHDGRDVLVSGAANGEVVLWDLGTKRPFLRLGDTGHDKGLLRAVALSPRLDSLLTQGRMGDLKLWAVGGAGEGEAAECRLAWQAGGLTFCPFELSPDGCLVALPSDEASAVVVWELETQTLRHTLVPEGQRGMCMSLAFAPPAPDRGSELWAGFEDGSVTLWAVGDQQVLRTLKLHAEPILALFVDAKRNRLVCAGAEDKITHVRLEPEESEPGTVQLRSAGVNSLRVRADGKLYACAAWDGSLRLFSASKHRSLVVLKHHRQAVNCLAFSHPLKAGGAVLLAAGSKDCRISLWSLYNSGTS